MGYIRDHKYHYIYKTTCNVTGRYYVGMHSTSNLEDGYIGSGQRLWKSIKKHGKDNHSIEILEWLPDRSSLKSREKELVNENLLSDPMCMNLQIGGGGGFTGKDHSEKFHKAGGKKVFQILSKRNSEKLKSDPEYRERWYNSVKKSGAFSGTFKGKKHSDETKQKMRDSAKNRKIEQNSQYGTCWITNGSESKKIKKTDNLPLGWEYGRKINLRSN